MIFIPEPIYSDEALDAYYDLDAHAYVNAIFERMGLGAAFTGCIFDQKAGKPKAGFAEKIEQGERKVYLVGVNRELTAPEKMEDGLLALQHECGHVYLMEKHPFVDGVLAWAERCLPAAHQARENLAFRIGMKYAKGILTPKP